MTRRVLWSDDALEDLGEIVEFHLDTEYALRLIGVLDEAGDRLGEVLSGQPGRVLGTFEKSLPRIRYILAFTVDRDRPNGDIVILRAIHMSRRWPKGKWPDD